MLPLITPHKVPPATTIHSRVTIMDTIYEKIKSENTLSNRKNEKLRNSKLTVPNSVKKVDGISSANATAALAQHRLER